MEKRSLKLQVSFQVDEETMESFKEKDRQSVSSTSKCEAEEPVTNSIYTHHFYKHIIHLLLDLARISLNTCYDDIINFRD